MGDSRRFEKFGIFIRKNFPVNRYTTVADVAGGKGYLQVYLREYGYNVTTFDKRKNKRSVPNKFQYQYRYFDKNVKGAYQLIVGMHPDEATDIIIAEAGRRNVAYAVVPCCVKPTVSRFRGSKNYTNWVRHLERFALSNNLTANRAFLSPLTGKRLVLYGFPKRR